MTEYVGRLIMATEVNDIEALAAPTVTDDGVKWDSRS